MLVPIHMDILQPALGSRQREEELSVSGRGTHQFIDYDQLPISFYLRGRTRQVFATCVSPCERHVAIASEDTTDRLWTALEGTLI